MSDPHLEYSAERNVAGYATATITGAIALAIAAAAITLAATGAI